jgi:uncharacterized protein YbaR (Trm112 family)
MFIELIDDLRCPVAHRQINLVAVIEERDERQILAATLGCPECHREYVIRDGIAWFTEPGSIAQRAEPAADDDNEEMIRIGAFLAVSDRVTVALAGKWARHAAALAELANIRVFAIDPTATVAVSERVGVLMTGGQFPFRNEILQGVAIDESNWDADKLDAAARVLDETGRMVAPAAAPVPATIEEVARDESVWVGQKRGPLVGLYRG